ncbi:MAG: glycosyltransferase [Candidatus Dormibacteria bacterium]
MLVAPDDDPGNRIADADGPPGVDVRLVSVPAQRDSAPARIRRRLLWLKDAPGASRRVRRALVADAELWRIVGQADLIELHFNYSLAFLDQVRRVAPRTPVVAVIYEVFSASLASRRRHGSRLRRAEAAILLPRARRAERRLLNRVSAIRVLADRDRDALRSLGVSRPIEVLPPWVDPVPAVQVSADETVLFVGALWRWENLHGVEWLLREVWPTVRRRRPAARLVLAGAGPPAALLDTHAAGVTVTGFVSDLAPYYAAARCVVAPVQVGGGIQVKVPQAMLHGLPVVATTFSAAGLGDHDARDALAGVHDSAEAFAGTVVELLTDRHGAEEAGARARALALTRWSADAYSERLLSTYAGFQPRG